MFPVVNWRREPLRCLWKFLPLVDFNTMLFLSLLSSTQAMVSVSRTLPHPLQCPHPQIIWAPPSWCFCLDSNKICLSNVCCLNEVMHLPGATFKTWAWQKRGVPLHKDFATRTAPVLELYPLSCLASTAPFYCQMPFIWAFGLCISHGLCVGQYLGIGVSMGSSYMWLC